MKTNLSLPRITSLCILTSCIFLIVITSAFGQTSNSARIQWAPNQERDLAGYRVYQGTVSGQYGFSKNVGLINSQAISNLDSNLTHYFTITAYDLSGNESRPSKEVSKSFKQVSAPPSAPAPPPTPTPSPPPTPTPSPRQDLFNPQPQIPILQRDIRFGLRQTPQVGTRRGSRW